MTVPDLYLLLPAGHTFRQPEHHRRPARRKWLWNGDATGTNQVQPAVTQSIWFEAIALDAWWRRREQVL